MMKFFKNIKYWFNSLKPEVIVPVLAHHTQIIRIDRTNNKYLGCTSYGLKTDASGITYVPCNYGDELIIIYEEETIVKRVRA